MFIVHILIYLRTTRGVEHYYYYYFYYSFTKFYVYEILYIKFPIGTYTNQIADEALQ